ncbi:ribosome maturation factor RimM [Jatrophihabitans telluris]
MFVEPWTDAVDERFADGVVLVTDPADRGPLTIESSRMHSGKLVVHFRGVDSRSAAEDLRGTSLVIRTADRPPIEDEDEFYDTELIGLRAELPDGQVLGPVTDVLHSTADSLLVIAYEHREVLVPFRKQFVPVVDLAATRVVVDPPAGLFEL